ncbi:MAG TPA: hypothetical protein VII38_14685 [Polyangia bacterium]
MDGGRFALERTHLARHDLDWLPPSMKAMRWAVAGSIWASLGAAVFGAAMLGHIDAVSGIFGSVGSIAGGGLRVGDALARRVMRRRLGRLTRETADLSSFAREADGELLHVRGRVRAARTVPGLVSGAPAVFRRVVFTAHPVRMVHEAAEDFSLVDEHGETITMLVDGARLLAPEPKLRSIARDRPLLERIGALPLPPKGKRALGNWHRFGDKGKRRWMRWSRALMAGEILLEDGDLIEAVGYKTRVVDPTVAARLERDIPMRATLRSGRELPLLISLVPREAPKALRARDGDGEDRALAKGA